MTKRKVILAAVAALTVATSAQAGSGASHMQSIDLGGRTGIAYYTPEAGGFRVVVNFARSGTTPALRFETVLASGQEALVSIPHELGQTAQAIRIKRSGDEIAVQQAVQEVASASPAQ